MAEFSLDTPNDKVSDDSNKHVKEWLASSQNHFSAPVTESQESAHSIEQVTSNIQIHSEKKNNPVAVEVVHVAPMQVDWDKIEEMPDTENVNKNNQNLIGPMDIEPFDVMDDDKDNSSEMPRRSLRNKENKGIQLNKVLADISSDKNSGDSSNVDKTNKHGKYWNNVKRMKKEFSKLNKKNRNKLNVSIEMCKKTQSIANKAVEPNLQNNLYDIDDSTPEVINGNKVKEASNYDSHVDEIKNNGNLDVNKRDGNVSKKLPIISENIATIDCLNNEICAINKHYVSEERSVCNVNSPNLKTQKVCFLKKSALNKENTIQEDVNENNVIYDENSKADCVVNSDDIEITIKIGNTLTNIFIKKKDNDVQLKINSDREIQTKNENLNANNEKASICSVITENKLKNTDTAIHMQKGKVVENIIIKSVTPKTQTLEKSTSVKKNTASAETATVNFEITESVERELSDILDNAQFINEQNKKIPTDPESKNRSQFNSHQQTQKPLQDIQEDMEYLNDLDIFDSESVKEGNVQALKTSKNTPSEILMPSMKINKILSLKDKRDRDVADLDEIPKTKKIKLTNNSINNENLIDDLNAKKNTMEQDSENINYDAIMSQVFANIDADMGNTNKTTKQGHTTDNENNSSLLEPNNDFNTSKGNTSIKDDIKQVANEKYSENIFSMLEKDSEILELSKSKVL